MYKRQKKKRATNARGKASRTRKGGKKKTSGEAARTKNKERNKYGGPSVTDVPQSQADSNPGLSFRYICAIMSELPVSTPRKLMREQHGNAQRAGKMVPRHHGTESAVNV